jgi:hypothetical protein
MEEVEFAREQNPEPKHDQKGINISHVEPGRFRSANPLRNNDFAFSKK